MCVYTYVYTRGNLLASFLLGLEIWCQMHKWQKDTKLLLSQCLVFLKLYFILRMTQLCPDQGCIYTGLKKSNFLILHFQTLCDPCCHSQSALSNSGLSKLELRNFPTRFFLCWFVAHQGTGRKAVPWKFPAHGLCLLLLQFRASTTGSQEPNRSLPLEFALSLYTELWTPLAITSIIQPGQKTLLYLKITYWILHKLKVYHRKIKSFYILSL